MLTHLHVKNFKAWKTLDIKLGRVTGLFGTNSSGKSSLLQFLLMLKHTKNATDRGLVLDFGGPGQLVNLGSYRDVVHGHDTEASLTWRLDWDLPQKAIISDPMKKRTNVLASDSSLSIRSVAHLQTDGNLLISDFLEYGFGDFSFSIEPKKKEAPSSS